MTSSPSASETLSTPTVPDRRRADKALMLIAVDGADLSLSSSWTKVDTPSNNPSNTNVGPVIFDYGVTITQKQVRVSTQAVRKLTEVFLGSRDAGVHWSSALTSILMQWSAGVKKNLILSRLYSNVVGIFACFLKEKKKLHGDYLLTNYAAASSGLVISSFLFSHRNSKRMLALEQRR